MDTLSAAYLPIATFDDGSCDATFKGCTDSSAATFRPLANRARPEDCEYTGCTRPDALNFDPSATRAGLCTTRRTGCTDPAAVNFVPGANVESECRYAGCTDSHASNWDPTATVDSGSCDRLLSCCTDSRSVNYIAACNHDDGSCSLGGCSDPTSTNATFDDSTPLPCPPSPPPGPEQLVRQRRRLLGSASGCRDQFALTYDSRAVLQATERGTCLTCLFAFEFSLEFGLEGCVYHVEGCTESGAAT